MISASDALYYGALAFALYFLYNMFFGGAKAEEILAALKDPRRVLLDTRSEGEWRADGIPSALNIPHHSIEAKAHLLPKDKTTPIIAYCASGNRVRTALSSLQALGYTNVLNARSNGRMISLLEQSLEQK